MRVEVPPGYDPMREWTVQIPQRLDGSGYVSLRMKAASMKYFGLDKFPRPEDYGRPYPDGKGIALVLNPRKSGANQGSFRLAYEWRDHPRKPHMCRFRLSANYRIETLQVITDFLRENYSGWFEIRNDHGNNCYRGYFSSDALLGGGRKRS